LEEDHGMEKEMVTGEVIINNHVFYSFIRLCIDIVLPYYLITNLHAFIDFYI
jgi:hypothetical protein